MPDDQSYLPNGRALRSLSDVELVEAAWRKHVADGYYDYLYGTRRWLTVIGAGTAAASAPAEQS